MVLKGTEELWERDKLRGPTLSLVSLVAWDIYYRNLEF